MKKRRIPVTQKTYIQISALMIGIAAIVLLVFSSFLFHSVKRYEEKQLQQFYAERARETALNVDMGLDSIRTYALNLFDDETIQLWMSLNYDDKLAAQNTARILKRYKRVESIIENIYVINYQMERVIDCNHGIADFDKLEDQGLLEFLNGDALGRLGFVAYSQGDKECLALILPVVPNKREYKADIGNVVMLIDQKKLLYRLIGKNSGGNVNIGIYNHRDQEFLQKELVEAAGLPHTITASYDLETEDWTITYLVDTTSFIKEMGRLQTALCCMIMGLMGVFLGAMAYVIRKNFLPFSHLAETIEQKTEKIPESIPVSLRRSKGPSEYHVIEKRIEDLNNDIRTLNGVILKNKKYIREGIVTAWVVSGLPDQEIKEYLEKQGNFLSSGKIRLVVLRIENYEDFIRKFEDYSYYKAVKHGMVNAVAELLGEIGSSVVFSDMGAEHLVLICSCLDQTEDEFILRLERVKAFIYSWIEEHVSIALSGEHSIYDNIHYVYQETLENTYMHLWLEDRIFTEQDRLPDTCVPKQSQEAMIEKICEAVCLTRTAELPESINALCETVKGLNYGEYKYRLVFYVYQIFNRFSAYVDFRSYEEIENIVKSIPTLEEMGEWLNSVLLSVAEQIGNKQFQQKKEEVSVKMKEYIKKNLSSPMLSVETISDEFGFSASYSRKIFKDNQGISISDYILKQRIECSKSILADSKKSVNEIIDASGFQTKSNFYTVFKKETGMTPNQYRIWIREKNGENS